MRQYLCHLPHFHWQVQIQRRMMSQLYGLFSSVWRGQPRHRLPRCLCLAHSSWHSCWEVLTRALRPEVYWNLSSDYCYWHCPICYFSAMLIIAAATTAPSGGVQASTQGFDFIKIFTNGGMVGWSAQDFSTFGSWACSWWTVSSFYDLIPHYLHYLY